MGDEMLDCVSAETSEARTLHVVRPEGLERFLSELTPLQAGFVRTSGFTAAAQELRLLPGGDGIEAAVLGLGSDRTPFVFGQLATELPAGSVWRLAPPMDTRAYDPSLAMLGFALGAYRYTTLKTRESKSTRSPARLVPPAGAERALAEAAAIAMARDLINTPANLLGPVELADAVAALARTQGAACTIVEGAELEREYPTVATVGRGSSRPARVAILRWSGSAATQTSPLIALCGKGVCFDTGGYDLKPSAAMLRMKKDMGGAAILLGLTRLFMERDLPIRLVLRVGCVENSVSGMAMRPLDVVRTRRGLTVEIGNTDAEGRLMLCDLLAEAADENPNLLIDCATLTGAARVALGPDLPALFCNDDAWAERLLTAGRRVHDPLWQLPLWPGYESWLDSQVGDLGNVSSKPFAGAVVAALFLQRFINGFIDGKFAGEISGRDAEKKPAVPWAHIDVYAWNDQSRPGRPEGGEAQGLRAIFDAVQESLRTLNSDQNRLVT
jgi:leucyl aminopeptidase